MSPAEDLPVRIPKKPENNNKFSIPGMKPVRASNANQNNVQSPGTTVPLRMPPRPPVQDTSIQGAPAIRISGIEEEPAPASEPAPVGQLRQREPTGLIDESPFTARKRPRRKGKVRVSPRASPKRPVKKTQTETDSKSKSNFSNYRYRTRLLKGSILPILYGIISIRMLNRYVLEFPDTFEYETLIILSGFLLGFGALAGLTISNMSRAKRNPQIGAELKFSAGIIALIPFLAILLTLTFVYGLSTAWQFSTGFFLTPLIPLLIVILFELNLKGKFYVREFSKDPSKGRKLIFVK